MRVDFVASLIPRSRLGTHNKVKTTNKNNERCICCYFQHVFSILQLLAKGVFLVGFVGNKGTFQHGLARILADKDLLFHLGYFGFCVLGLCINELFYSLLVREYI